jgi:hypothetical protein
MCILFHVFELLNGLLKSMQQQKPGEKINRQHINLTDQQFIIYHIIAIKSRHEAA